MQDFVVTIQDTYEDNVNQEYGFNYNPNLIAIYFGSSDGLIKYRVYSDSGFNNYKSTIDNKGVLEFSRKYDLYFVNDSVRKADIYKFQMRDRFSKQLANSQSNRDQNNYTNQFRKQT